MVVKTLKIKYKSQMNSTYSNLTQTIFRDKRQYKLFLFLCLSSLFDCLLVFYRLHHTDFDWQIVQNFNDFKFYRGAYGTFFFLIWNLFLAWIPYWFALTLDFYTRISLRPSSRILVVLLGLWLLFFPNSPYIVTDLLHLRDRYVMPHWYDVMMFISFAWTGLLLGYSSLFEVQRFLESRFKPLFTWSVMVGAIWLGGFGVFMGRFQRWNSWDIVTHPFRLIKQQIHVLLNPFDHLNTLGVAVVLSGFMLIGYLTLNALRTPVEV